MEVVAISDVGAVRTNDEDNFYCNGIWREDIDDNHFEYREELDKDDICVFSVMDGMGGMKDGEIASLIAVEDLHEQCLHGNAEDLSQILLHINEAVCEESKRRRGHIGTTAVIARVSHEKVMFANVGDSRGYLLQNGELIRMTVDHTARSGLESISDDLGIDYDLYGNVDDGLTQFLGVDKDEFIIEPEVSDENRFDFGDMILLCSDGLTSCVEDNRIKGILCGTEDLSVKAKKLIDVAIEQGSKDNITVVLVKR